MTNRKRFIRGFSCFSSLVIITIGATLASGSISQDEGEEGIDRWEPFQYFVGEWAGSGEGLGGSATLTRSCEQILHDNFIFMKTQSIFPPQEANPDGKDHQDWGMISYDKDRERYILRQFFGEGFINQYTAEISEDGKNFVFTTEKIESFEPGWHGISRPRTLCSMPRAARCGRWTANHSGTTPKVLSSTRNFSPLPTRSSVGVRRYRTYPADTSLKFLVVMGRGPI